MSTRWPLAVTAIGLVMMVGMIVFEDEPGALPLLMIVLGSAWFFLLRARTDR